MRAIARYFAFVGGAALLALAHWTGAESVTPGQQYADPWLPCLYIGLVPGGVAYLVVEYVGVVREVRADRRKRGAGT